MLDPVSLTLALSAIVCAVIRVVILMLQAVQEWFHTRKSMKEASAANVGFTLQNALDGGGYRTVQGIYNDATNEVLDARAVHSQDIDSELAAVHAGKQLVVYQ